LLEGESSKLEGITLSLFPFSFKLLTFSSFLSTYTEENYQ